MPDQTATEDAVLGGEPSNPEIDHALSLNRALDDYWTQVDQASSDKEAAAAEPKEAPETTSDKESPKEATTPDKAPEMPDAGKQADKAEPEKPSEAEPKKEEPEKDEEDEALEKLQAPHNARPQLKADWDSLKTKIREKKEQLRSTRTELDKARQEREALSKSRDEEVQRILKEHEAFKAEVASKKPSDLPDEVKGRLEKLEKENQELKGNLYQQDYSRSPEFQEKYQAPIGQTFDRVMDDLVQIWGGGDDVKGVIGQIKSQIGPNQISKDWFKTQIFGNDAFKKADLFSQQEVAANVRKLFDLREERDRSLEQAKAHPEKFKEKEEQERKSYSENYLKGAHEAEKEFKVSLGEWASTIDPATAKDDADRSRIEAHNKAANEYRRKAEDYVKLLQAQDPSELGRAHVTLAANAVKAAKLERDLQAEKAERAKVEADHKAELQKVRLENERLSKEAAKLSAARSIPSKAGGVSQTKPKPSLDIFADNPFKSGNQWDDI